MNNSGFDRMGRPRSWGLRQAARRLLLGCLPKSRFCSTGGPHFPVQWTFDDGPDPVHTPRILDVLQKHDQQAAFFMVGARAEQQPALVRRIVEQGHLIGSHSHTHPARGTLSTANYLADIRRARAVLESITGRSVPIFRPPHGYLSAAVLMRLMQADWRVVLWSVDPKDYAIDSPAEFAERLQKSELTKSDIVLLHDTSNATVEGLERLLRETNKDVAR